jgi:hypothetical protein
MLGDESAADDLAVFLQIENVRRARFKSGDVPASDALLQALPGVKARIAGIWAVGTPLSPRTWKIGGACSHGPSPISSST